MTLKEARNLVQEKEGELSKLRRKAASYQTMTFVGDVPTAEVSNRFDGVIDSIFEETEKVNIEMQTLKKAIKRANSQVLEDGNCIEDLLFLLKQTTAMQHLYEAYGQAESRDRINTTSQLERTVPTYDTIVYAEKAKKTLRDIRALQNRLDLLNLTIEIDLDFAL